MKELVNSKILLQQLDLALDDVKFREFRIKEILKERGVYVSAIVLYFRVRRSRKLIRKLQKYIRIERDDQIRELLFYENEEF